MPSPTATTGAHTWRYRAANEKLDHFIDRIERECGVGIVELEYGPGFPVEYFERDEQAARQAENEPMRALAEALEGMRFSGTVILELGRRLVATCGTYVTRVVDTKRVEGQRFAIVDGGMHQIAYYGHAMAMKQPPCELLAPRGRGDGERWTVCGSLCTTSDMLAKQMPLGIVEVGDLLAFRKAGAYCMTEGLSLFLSRDLPSVVLCDQEGRLHLARDRVETAALNSAYAWQLGQEARPIRDWMDDGAVYRKDQGTIRQQGKRGVLHPQRGIYADAKRGSNSGSARDGTNAGSVYCFGRAGESAWRGL